MANADRIIELLHEAKARPQGGERERFLAEACGDDAALKEQIVSLLKADTEEGESDFLRNIPINREAIVLTEKPGDRIGRYKLLEQIGEGGCGVVYMAEQQEPVRRRVALKVIKLGMDTKQVIARFEAERQALAMMDHPNIAKVLDAGATETGRPFFVMELVRGIRITDYCDQNHLSTRERLELFIQVCQAIQHAHQKGIIHRDIKPSNILVTHHDDVAVPKIIDFGISKATIGQLTDKTVFTAFAQFVGTPAYMSPEQAQMSGLDIDTRADIYSLGVLLYELLTGNTPFDAKELLAAGMDEMRRKIREDEPAKPSTCLSTMLAIDLTTVAKHRHAEPPRLIHLIRGDLDWLVMKCLEKDRTRRYETANALATDLQRHLNDEPVIARPPSTAYRFQKLIRRNKLAFIAVGAVTTALLIGLVFSTFSFLKAKKNLSRAKAAEQTQEGMRVQAEQARTGEAQARATAEERLYNSLVAQVRATRHNQSVGYRDTALALLKQARLLNVPQKDLAELRREAVACMGDFIGVTPTTFDDFPNNTWNDRMQISPNGQLAAFGLSDGTMLLCQLPSGAAVASLTNHHDEITSFCFNVSGDQIIALHTPRNKGGIREIKKAQLSVWTAGADGLWKQTQSAPFPGGARCLSSSKGLFVATCDPAARWSTVWQLIDLKTREAVQKFDCRFIDEIHMFPHLAMSSDGKFLAVSKWEQDFAIDLWDLNAHQRVQTFKPDVGMFVSLNFSPEGDHLACLGGGGSAIFTMAGFQQANLFKEEFAWPDNPSSWPAQVAFAPGTSMIALPILQEHRLRLWDFERNRDLAVLEEAEASRTVAFAPDASFFLTSGGRHARLYRLFQTPEKLELPVHDAMEMAFSPDGARIALTSSRRSSGVMQRLTVCDVTTGRILWKPALLASNSFSVAYSPDGRTIATAGLSGVQLWDEHGGKLLLESGTKKIQQHQTGFLQFASDGQRLLAGEQSQAGSEIGVWAVERHGAEYGDGSLEVRPLKSFDAKLEKLESYDGALKTFVLTPDDRHVACGTHLYNSYMGKIYICDLDGSTPPHLLATNINVSGGQIWTPTPDRRQLLVVDADREVVTLDVTTGKRITSFPIGARLEERVDWSGHLSLSPDGTKLAVVEDTNRDVDIYDPKTGRVLYSLPDQNGRVTWLAWSPNGQRLAVSRSNGEVAIWNVAEVEQMLAKLNLSP